MNSLARRAVSNLCNVIYHDTITPITYIGGIIMPKDFICKKCNKPFQDLGYHRRKYCSHLCYSNSRKDIPNFAAKIRPTLNICKWCGKKFETGGRARPSKRTLYCSLNCLAFGRIKEPKVNLLSKTDSAYLAGLIDGEGCIMPVNRNKKGRITWRLSIANTNAEVLVWVKYATGCGSLIRKNTKEKEYHLDSYNWQCYSWNAKAILEQTINYMIIKKAKAIELIKDLDDIRNKHYSISN